MKRILTTLIAILFAVTLLGQSPDDACLFSQTYYQGTAKAMGMGNAMGAVGGDMTAVGINPAGMGIYRSDEIAMSLNLLDNYQKSSYYGSDNSANKMRLSIPNIGWVHAKQKSNYKTVRFMQFGIGLTRTNDYNKHNYAKGLNPISARANNGIVPSQLESIAPDNLSDEYYHMWQTYLIDDHYTNAGYNYTSNVPQGNVWQTKEEEFKGRSEEWSFTGSVNCADRLFIGMNLNITHFKRTGTQEFEELRNTGVNNDFVSWETSEDISSSAIGFNAKIGLIYRANNWLRLGAAFHSPSFNAFDETRQTVTTSQFVSSGQHTYTGQEYSYEYTFISPLKWVGSAAFIIDERGMVALDVEYTNFGAARFNTTKNDDYDYTPTNEAIKDTYGRTFNLRLGSEWRLGASYLRLGMGYYGSPFGFGKTGDSIKKASCGISVPVSRHTYFDFAYELAYGQSYTYLYDAGDLDLEPVTYRQFKNNLLVTLKVKY